MAKRIKVEGYIGIYYRMAERIGASGQERVYYVTFKRGGKVIEAKAGRQHKDNMTPAKANQYRSRLIDGKEKTPQEKRAATKAAKAIKANRWTVDRLWQEYRAGRKPGKGLDTDAGRYDKYLKPVFAKKEPIEILALDVERLKRRLLKKKSPQTTKHVLNLLTWVVNFGVKQNLCEGLSFHVEKPTVNNLMTEDLSPKQMKALLQAINDYSNAQIKNLMLMAIHTGMRRGELFKLRWEDVNFERGFVSIVDPKGGPDQKIPLNTAAREILGNHPRPKFKVKGTKNKHIESPYVFPGRDGQQRVSCQAGVNEIKKNAGLPNDFRPMHGLRHVYASMLASSGEVDMYVLQRLLTHKDPRMTQRYAHLRDEALKQASQVAGDIVTDLVTSDKNERVVNLEEHKNTSNNPNTRG